MRPSPLRVSLRSRRVRSLLAGKDKSRRAHRRRGSFARFTCPTSSSQHRKMHAFLLRSPPASVPSKDRWRVAKGSLVRGAKAAPFDQNDR